MPVKSKLELKGLLERAYILHEKEGKTHAEIAEIFHSEGFNVSKSAVQRALRAKSLNDKEYKKKLEATKAFVEATKDTPGLQLAKAASDLIVSMLLTEIQGMEDLSSLEDSEIIDKLAKITKCQNDIAQTNLNYEKGYQAGLFKAKDALENAGKKGGTPEEVLNIIKKELGLGV